MPPKLFIDAYDAHRILDRQWTQSQRREKIDVLTPMPSVRVSTAAAAKPGDLRRVRGVNRQLSPPFGRQSVELGAALVLRRALFNRNPSPFDEPVQAG